MIPYGKHSINLNDVFQVAKTLKSDWLTTGPRVFEFEEILSDKIGAPCIAVNSGTAALHCAYAAIDLQPGDEIITPPITFIATQATAANFGAKVLFADVQSDTANIDPQAVLPLLTKRTKAIVAVDYAGHPAEMTMLRKIADENNIFLIEDAAHSIGSIYRGRQIGSLADITTFSFFPTKNITTGEGGAITSLKRDLLEKAKIFSRQGLIRSKEGLINKDEGDWHQEVHSFGLNYRLPDILCSLGISQLKRLEEFKTKKRKIFNFYNENLFDLDIKLPVERTYVDTNWHLYPIRVRRENRKFIFNELRTRGIGVQVNYLPAYKHPVFKSSADFGINFPNSELFYAEEISLPMYPSLKKKDLIRVVKTLREVLK